MDRLVRILCLVAAIAIQGVGPMVRLSVAQQPFGSPGDSYTNSGVSAPAVPSNNASFSNSPNNGPPGTSPNGQNVFGTQEFPNTAQPESPELVPLEGGQIIARVGGLVIVAGDVLPRVNQIIAEEMAKMPPEQRAQMPSAALEQAKRNLMQRELLSLIETKLLFGDAKRVIPKENFPTVLQKLDEQFDKAELPHLLEDAKARNRVELDQKFNQQGTSLMQQKKAYSERLLAMEWLKQQIDFKRPVHHDEMLAYYHEHIAEYEFEAKARFEEVMVRFDRFPNKGAAYAALANIGNQLLQGATLAELAKTQSHGPTAREGGQYGFVSRGSLVLPILNEAVFTLPVGQLSQILESEHGFHIVRVLERTDSGRTPFEEAQLEIRKILQKQDTDKQIKEYLARLRRETRVWTVFDGPVEQQALKPE